MSTLYTNTGKVGSVIGLVVTTVLVTYAAQHSTEIVNGVVSICKTGVKQAKKAIEKVTTKEYQVWSTDVNGQIYDTGMKIRK